MMGFIIFPCLPLAFQKYYGICHFKLEKECNKKKSEFMTDVNQVFKINMLQKSNTCSLTTTDDSSPCDNLPLRQLAPVFPVYVW